MAAAPITKVGAGSYLSGIPAGAKSPPDAPWRAETLHGPTPTNDWCSALWWSDKPFPLFPHPLAVAPHESGLRIAYPGAKIATTKGDVLGVMPGGLEDLVLGHSAVEKFEPPVVEAFSDWFVRLVFADGTKRLSVSFGHGSPFVFARFAGGQPRVRFAAVPKIWAEAADGAVLGISINGRHFGLFGPTGAKWSGQGSAALECQAAGKDYCSVAVLPDDRLETLALFQRHAHAHIADTRMEWAYDEPTSAATTQFHVTTQPMEGAEKGTLFALYPHQWRNATTPLLPLSYGSVRGAMKLAEGESFTVRMIYPGVLPALPNAGGVSRDAMAALLAGDSARKEGDFKDTYWEGKQLGRVATLLPLAEQYGLTEIAASLRARLRERVEAWLSAEAPDGTPKTRGVFAYEPRWGTLIGYPASFGSDDQLNDHHFHYGYFIRAAAEIARRDPAWARDEKWGGMVKLLIRDIASADRRDPLFPFLRCFDPGAGHSWASGHARFGDGNNNESSSEALNAWSGLILWGDATGDRATRDLGIWLFTTELHAVEEYWFDVHGDNFPAAFQRECVGMVWGGKSSFATWFSAKPEAIHGINWLPITGASTYLGRFPDYAARNYAAMAAEKGGAWDTWPDIMAMYRALSDPADAARQLDAAPPDWKPEEGNSRAQTEHWIRNLAKLGRVDRTVTADAPCYAVFDDGKRKVHAAYNSSAVPRTVIFSDGVKLSVAPGGFALQ